MSRRFLLLPALLLLAAPARPQDEAGSEFQRHARTFQLKCAKCHTIGGGDRVGPDLKGLLERRDRAWAIGFLTGTDAYLDSDPQARELLEKFNGVRMPDFRLSEAQAEGLLEYVESAAAAPASAEPAPAEPPLEPYQKVPLPAEGRAVSWTGLASLVPLLLLGFALWRAGRLYGAGAILILSAGVAYLSAGGRSSHVLPGYQQGYAPEQPIPYSHKTHAGDLGISCVYCHHGAEKSPVAGVPGVSTCMNCHRAVDRAAGAAEPSEAIARIKAVWETRNSDSPKTIPWVRVHDLPDYVAFSHRSHTGNDIQCQECHGPVQEMERVRQAAPLSMGWCIECHRQGPREAPSHWLRAGGPVDCSACHW